MKLWKIREGYDPYDERMDMHDDEAEKAYEQGYKKGYRDAMKEMDDEMGFRGNGGYSGGGPSYRSRSMQMRDGDDDYESMGERRRRDSRGRYM